jgi:outer membrane protein OmpA-like peptidoglycan-associated protein
MQKLLAEMHEQAYNCAPKALAEAEANIDFAKYESGKGRFFLAAQYLEDARNKSKEAWKNSRGKECLGDRDEDGIADKDDHCPDDPEDIDNFQDQDGCPDPDNDVDGVPDKIDKCPIDREDIDGFEDQDGCPDPDNDKDGIPDVEDKCPNSAEDIDGFEDKDGCPDVDNDKDGINDPKDKCPNDPGPPETEGCPYKRIQITDKMIILKEKIFFAFNKAVIKPESFPLLDEIVQALADHPTFIIRIEGHTDNKGNKNYNKTLSQKRAEAVRAYIIRKGIDGSRLTAVGYGMEKPIADNKTEDGRAINRRVEFHIVSK